MLVYKTFSSKLSKISFGNQFPYELDVEILRKSGKYLMNTLITFKEMFLVKYNLLHTQHTVFILITAVQWGLSLEIHMSF